MPSIFTIGCCLGKRWTKSQAVGLAAALLSLASASSAWAIAPGAGAQLDGEKLYNQHCAQCHSSEKPSRAPRLNALKLMEPQDVVDALEIGSMKFTGFKRTAEERRAIAEFVTGKKFSTEQEAKETLSGRCRSATDDFDPIKAAMEWVEYRSR